MDEPTDHGDDPASLASLERLDKASRESAASGPRALEALCMHVVSDRTYADSTRAVFAEILEQVRAALGRG